MKKYSIVFLALGALIGTGCNNDKKELIIENEKFCLDPNFKKGLELVTVTRQKITEGIHLTGTVDANPDKVVSFKSLFSGIVTETYFSLGDKVQKGQLLAEISSTEYSALQAELKGVESQIKVAVTKLKSTRAMFDDQMASQKELDEAQSELNILKAEKARVSSNLNLYSASTSKNVFQIKAPASGIITDKNIAVGMQITGDSDEPLFIISNLDKVWIMANVYASNLQDVKTGMEVEITSISYPDEVFKGKIAVISQVFDTDANVLKARIELDNTDFKLKPGMLVDVMALQKKEVEAESIPAAELIFSENENYVLVYKGDCDIEVRKVDIIAKNPSTVFIANGIKENEKVIAKNQLLIFNRLMQH